MRLPGRRKRKARALQAWLAKRPREFSGAGLPGCRWATRTALYKKRGPEWRHVHLVLSSFAQHDAHHNEDK